MGLQGAGASCTNPTTAEVNETAPHAAPHHLQNNTPQDVAVAALGDTQFLPDYTWLRRRTYWLRY